MPDATPHTGTISDLEKNRVLLDWLRWQVGQTERRIRELEIQEVEERERRARAEMSWKVQPQRSSSVAGRRDGRTGGTGHRAMRGLPAGHRTAGLNRHHRRRRPHPAPV
ncbi:hypothetical protein OG379_00795 [Streptomyces sp. NBC_01166]|nr:hypothetical protein OG379_00795 [Streptomyces sp. NBC_01166]